MHELQLELHAQRRADTIGDVLLLLDETRDTVRLYEQLEAERHRVLGRGAKPEHLLASNSALAARGVTVHETGRGGDITLHAPGQLVCYPILNLAPDRCDVRRYVGDLIATMAAVAESHGVQAGALDGYPGLWVDTRAPGNWPSAQGALAKLGAVGVRISRWVTMHGFSLNLTSDLTLFELIVPCGIREYPVTSIERLVGIQPDIRGAAELAAATLVQRLGRAAAPLEDRETEALDSLRGSVAA